MSAESSPRFHRVLLSSAITLLNGALMIAVYRCSDARSPAFTIFLSLSSLFCFVEAMLVEPAVILSREDGEGPTAAWTGASIVATFLTAIATANSPTSIATTSGAALMVLGILLRAIAIHTLGARFTTELRAEAPLIRHGIYRWLDHPSELGLLCATLGSGVMFRSKLAFAIWLVCTVPLTILRVRAENAFLRAHGVR